MIDISEKEAQSEKNPLMNDTQKDKANTEKLEIQPRSSLWKFTNNTKEVENNETKDIGEDNEQEIIMNSDSPRNTELSRSYIDVFEKDTNESTRRISNRTKVNTKRLIEEA